MPNAKEFIESREEIEGILRGETMGFLGLSVDGMPYVVPLTYGYVDGRILFHGALTGKKLDCIKANPNVCFTVGRQHGELVRHPQGALCHVAHDSAICYGVARIVEYVEERSKTLQAFNGCLKPDARELTSEAASKCSPVEIKIAEMTGRRQRGQEYTFFRYQFAQHGQVRSDPPQGAIAPRCLRPLPLYRREAAPSVDTFFGGRAFSLRRRSRNRRIPAHGSDDGCHNDRRSHHCRSPRPAGRQASARRSYS